MENISLSFSLPFRGRGELYIDGTMHKAVNKQQRAVSLSQITFFFGLELWMPHCTFFSMVETKARLG